MITVTRRNPNGVRVAEPASVDCRTGLGAALQALMWARRGYAVEMRSLADDTLSRIRRRPMPLPAFPHRDAHPKTQG